jgi:hypothetical protein
MTTPRCRHALHDGRVRIKNRPQVLRNAWGLFTTEQVTIEYSNKNSS